MRAITPKVKFHTIVVEPVRYFVTNDYTDPTIICIPVKQTYYKYYFILNVLTLSDIARSVMTVFEITAWIGVGSCTGYG